MNKYKELKNEIDKLYALSRESDNKCNSLDKAIQEDLSNTEKNMAIMNSHFESVIKTLDKFMLSFEAHDKEEMAKYSKIEDELNTLKSLPGTVDKLIKTQAKFLKFFYIGTGVIITIGMLISAITFIADLYSKIPK